MQHTDGNSILVKDRSRRRQKGLTAVALIPLELIGCFNLIFYNSAEDAVFKALGVEQEEDGGHRYGTVCAGRGHPPIKCTAHWRAKTATPGS